MLFSARRPRRRPSRYGLGALLATGVAASIPGLTAWAQAPAEARAADLLFASESVLRLTLATDIDAFARDRDSTASVFHPATLSVADTDGVTTTLDIQIRTRGHWRRQAGNCTMPPVLLVVAGSKTKHTLFAHQKALKLVAHCRESGDYEQYILREYLVYRMLNRLTPRSFRVRLVRATYVDVAGRRAAVTRYAFLVEDQHRMAARLGGTILRALGATYDNIDSDQALLVAAFEYMIGNTDWSMAGLHNIRLVAVPQSLPLAVPYDFDFSGLVDTRYASVDPRLRLRSVRQRLYRGGCRTAAEWAPTVAHFNARRADIYALYDSPLPLNPDYVNSTRRYLDEFYATINDPRALREQLIEPCREGA
ncbi:MAG: hypothetical protein NVS1B4_12790 [Gemmatimonadaceae bacterium]